MKRLVIVESPTKAKTLAPMLGAGYTVRATLAQSASVGHVRDLPTDEMGVDTLAPALRPALGGLHRPCRPSRTSAGVEHSFKPTYRILRQKSKTLKELRSALEGAGEVYLATDRDIEEGEDNDG